MLQSPLQPASQKTLRRRWWLRLMLSLLAACLAWWGVQELVTPRPIARLKLHQHWSPKDTIQVGSCCILELHHSQAYHRDKVVVLDLATKTLHDDDTRFGLFHQNLRLIPHLVTSHNRYVLQFLHGTSLLVHDIVTGSKTRHDFPAACNLTVQENRKILVQATPFPIAPFSALSPAAWSAIPAALLMSCDAQRLHQQPIGPTLVQVRQIPEMNEIARYALPVSPGLKELQLSADGEYLLRAFMFSKSAYPIPSEDLLPTERRVESLVIPVRLGAMRKLAFAVGGNMNLLAHWAYARVERISNGKPHPSERHTIEVDWVDIDLSEAWTNLDNQFEIFDAKTGNLINRVSLKSPLPGVDLFCNRMAGNWVLISVTEPLIRAKELRGPGVFHVPTGRIVSFSELPETFWDRNYLTTEWVDGHQSGETIVRSSYRGHSNADKPCQVVLFRSDGSTKTVVVTSNQTFDKLIPHSSQMLKVESLFETLPQRLRSLIARWTWLKTKLSARRLSILDLDSGSMLWNVPVLPMHLLEWPPPHVSRDGKLLLVPVEKTSDHYIYAMYALPISTRLAWWPWLAALLVLVVLWLPAWKRNHHSNKNNSHTQIPGTA